MSFKITRFFGISIFGSKLVDKTLKYDDIDSPYIVDKSKFCPMHEALSQLNANSALSSGDLAYYDFKDGKDTGAHIPVQRLHDVKDLAEMSVELRKMNNDLLDTYKKELQVAKDKDFIQSLVSGSGKVDNLLSDKKE